MGGKSMNNLGRGSKNLETFSVNLSELTKTGCRFDASYYAEEARFASKLLERETGFSIIQIQDLCTSDGIFNPPPVKREYSDETGTPYLMPSELFLFRVEPTKYVHAAKIESIDEWFVKEGWLIITQSGNTGIPLYLTEVFEDYVISQNAIRLVTKERAISGYIYAYLNTWIGKALIQKDEFGATVKHLRPHHVAKLRIPVFPKTTIQQISRIIIGIFKLRDLGRQALEDAEKMLYSELDLPAINTSQKRTVSFSISSGKLNQRFDAYYHNPTVQRIKQILGQKGERCFRLDEVAKCFIPGRFKRIYVDEEFGVPFLQGTDITLIYPRLLKYLSRTETKNLENWIIESDWILLTCSGTLGNVSYSPTAWDGWAVTQHVARIIPDSSQLHPGYLASFLQSDYGHLQILSKAYGAVVDELSEDGLNEIIIPIAPKEVQLKIGQKVIQAYELRELANELERKVVSTFESMIEGGIEDSIALQRFQKMHGHLSDVLSSNEQKC